MTTPHINAVDGAFAETVLMPGDPLRAKYIAETFLEDAVQVTDVRNMFGFTGTYQGKKVSVMGHGMGIPSCSIYAHELITEYGEKNIIRVGSCGAVSLDVKCLTSLSVWAHQQIQNVTAFVLVVTIILQLQIMDYLKKQ